MPLYGGIDLHANNSVVVLLNEQDEVIYRKRLANNLPVILEQLAPYHAELKGLVVESTYNWYWLVDGLMEAEYRVHLANPAAMQQYNGLKYTDDHSDARWLAHLLRLGVLPEGYIYPKAERAVRDLLRKRTHLVRQHTANVLRRLAKINCLFAWLIGYHLCYADLNDTSHQSQVCNTCPALGRTDTSPLGGCRSPSDRTRRDHPCC